MADLIHVDFVNRRARRIGPAEAATLAALQRLTPALQSIFVPTSPRSAA